MSLCSHNLSRRKFLHGAAAALAASQASLVRASFSGNRHKPGVSIPRPLVFGSYQLAPKSDLAHRTEQNYARLQDPIYRPPLVFRQTNWQSWPGDFEGRALLGVTLLARSTGNPPGYLAAMPAVYRQQLNDQGYFGPVLNRGAINEQQLSGHGWYLRALCESYAYTHDSATLDQISQIVRNLALPVRGAYASYPIDPAMRTRATAPSNPGAVDGHLDSHHGDWVVSSDTGCAFIFLDGVTQAWATLRDAGDPSAAPLKGLIDEAIARFIQIDLVAIKAQTHASLTALRAVMRMYVCTGEAALLATVRDRYALYRRVGMTEHYANTNWFGRPDSWTEPCAIIDSFIVATQLWQHTGDPAYLEDAHRIWFNGIGRGLRANGGFGTDTCPGHTPFVRVRSYEAYFCCTMRGGEGHARAAQYLYFTQPAKENEPAMLTVPFFASSTVSPDILREGLALRQTTQYPYDGDVTLEFLPRATSQHGSDSYSARASAASGPQPILLRFFTPTWTDRHEVLLNGHTIPTTREKGFLTVLLIPQRGDVLTLKQALRVAPRDPISSVTPRDSYVFEAGPLVLGYKPPETPNATLRSPDPEPVLIPRAASLTPTDAPGVYRDGGTGRLLSPINDLNTAPDPSRSLPHPRQLLFRQG